MKNQKINIELQAFDHGLLDQASKEIVNTVKRTGAKVGGPIPMPTNIEKFTVVRSPHVYKKSREQFEIRMHKRLIGISDHNPTTVDALGKIALPYGVDVKVKVKGE